MPQRDCPDCGGIGLQPFSEEKCETCKGDGEVHYHELKIKKHTRQGILYRCDECGEEDFDSSIDE